MLRIPLNSTSFPPSKHVVGFAKAVVDGDNATADALIDEQYKKVCEEYGELVEAWAHAEMYGDSDAQAHICEECADLIQSASNMLYMLSFLAGTDSSTVMTAVKMKCVARDKGFYPASMF